MSKVLEIQENVPLAPFTTLEVGGPARYFVRCEAETEIIEALEFARENRLPIFVLGGGSNIVISDEGFEGIVIEVATDRSLYRVTDVGTDDIRKITAGAGENWDEFVSFCVSNELSGIECLSGIPGSVGGTPVQNVGAYGQEVSETIDAVRCIEVETLRPVRLTNSECGFAYRQSVFNTSASGRYIIYDVTFRLTRGGEPKMVYRDLVERFGGRRPSLAEVRETVISIRRSKSMVIDEHDENRRSVGSFFKNPVLSQTTFDNLARTCRNEVPHFPASAGYVKVPAAWLIEQSGFQKGYTMGKVGISTNHTLAIVNLGGATAHEVVSMKDVIRSAVYDRFDIELVPEPVFVGRF